MSNEEILDEIIKGMCPYLSCGVPTPYWDLAIKLTLEVYGEKGKQLLELVHKTYESAIDCYDDELLHTLYGFENDGNTEITIDVIISRLKKLK